MGQQDGLYPGYRRCGHRPWKSLEVSVSYGAQRRISVPDRLSVFYLHPGCSRYDYGDVPGKKDREESRSRV